MMVHSAVRAIRASDPAFTQAKMLRYRALFKPFGVPENTDFGDTDPASTHVVALDGGRVVGYARLVRRGNEAQIRHLCVDPKVQGRGLGTELMKTLIERARDAGAKTVFLNARFTALGVYRRLGFAEVGPLIPAEDVALPHKRMELKL